MRPIPLLAEEGAERERDSAKPQEWLRHQKNAAKPQRRRRRARSASAIARSRNSGQFGWPSKGCRTDHPVRDKSERIHFLMSRTPLLCEEGNVRPENFVQKTKSCSLVTHRGIAATKGGLTAETQRKIRNQIALRTLPSLPPTSTSGARMFGFSALSCC